MIPYEEEFNKAWSQSGYGDREPWDVAENIWTAAIHFMQTNPQPERIGDVLPSLIDHPWPLRDILAKLVEAAGILLDEKDYDGHGHESIAVCRSKAKEILTKGGDSPLAPQSSTTSTQLTAGVHSAPSASPAAPESDPQVAAKNELEIEFRKAHEELVSLPKTLGNREIRGYANGRRNGLFEALELVNRKIRESISDGNLTAQLDLTDQLERLTKERDEALKKAELAKLKCSGGNQLDRMTDAIKIVADLIPFVFEDYEPHWATPEFKLSIQVAATALREKEGA